MLVSAGANAFAKRWNGIPNVPKDTKFNASAARYMGSSSGRLLVGSVR